MTEEDLFLTWLPKLGLAKDHHLPHMSHIKVEDLISKRMVAEAFLKKRKNSAVRPELSRHVHHSAPPVREPTLPRRPSLFRLRVTRSTWRAHVLS